MITAFWFFLGTTLVLYLAKPPAWPLRKAQRLFSSKTPHLFYGALVYVAPVSQVALRPSPLAGFLSRGKPFPMERPLHFTGPHFPPQSFFRRRSSAMGQSPRRYTAAPSLKRRSQCSSLRGDFTRCRPLGIVGLGSRRWRGQTPLCTNIR